MKSVKLTKEKLKSYDLVVLSTDHSILIINLLHKTQN